MNKDPSFSLHSTLPMASPWQRAALALVLEKKSISLRLRGHLSKASVCAAPGPARTLCLVHPPEQHAPCLCMRRALCWEGNGQHDPVQGFLSIRLALIPLGFVKWMGLKHLPEKGHFAAGAHCSIPQGRLGSPREEGAGWPTHGCSPACLSMGGEQIRDILTSNLGPLVLATQL